jgi:hypothetical protein
MSCSWRQSCLFGQTLIVLALVASVDAQGGTADENGALVALSSGLEIEQTLLNEDLERHTALSVRRAQLNDRLAELYRSLDSALRAERSEISGRGASLLGDIDRVEAQRKEHLIGERTLVERIHERKRRIVLIEAQIALLATHRAELAGALTGTWDVVLLPSDQRGVLQLRQNGTLISGTYRLAGGWTGSLQGTLIERKVYLVRIDSKLGRSMELEGVLSSDGDLIRGSWLNYELAGSAGGNGDWSARRRIESP